MHSTFRFRYVVIEWRMFYLYHAGQNGVTMSCSNPQFSSSVRWSDTAQRFSVAISDVWDYVSRRFSVAISDCVTANCDRATFIALLVTTAPFLLQEPFFSDTPKSTRSFLGHMTPLTGSSWSTIQKSVLLPSSKLDVVVLCILCVCTVLVTEARGGSGGWGTALQAGGRGFNSRYVPPRRTLALKSTQPLTEMSTRGI
jgi:hypothetical protein